MRKQSTYGLPPESFLLTLHATCWQLRYVRAQTNYIYTSTYTMNTTPQKPGHTYHHGHLSIVGHCFTWHVQVWISPSIQANLCILEGFPNLDNNSQGHFTWIQRNCDFWHKKSAAVSLHVKYVHNKWEYIFVNFPIFFTAVRPSPNNTQTLYMRLPKGFATK